MPLYAYNSDVEFTSTLSLANRDTVVIGANGYVFGQDALFSASSNVRFSILGTVATDSVAIVIGGPGLMGFNPRITIGETGQVVGYHGIALYGAALDLVNHGLVNGSESAVHLENWGAAALTSRIINTGTLFGDDYGIQGNSDTIDALIVENTGLIASRSLNKAIYLSDDAVANDRVINSGMIRGGVALGGGNDLYDGRGGGTVDGLIGGGLGDDRFRPGAAEEVFAGDGGNDTLDFRGGTAGVTIALDNSLEQGGWAEGDSWSGIENVTGTRGDDRIGGDGAANRLIGAAGADFLSGAAGNDTLEGGEGLDLLTGGAGNDTFQFRRPGEGGDVISDFSALAAGNDDRIAIAAAGFGAGLSAGTLAATRFQIRADNAAQDADDRFILRTTDKTLWFDADGSGSGAAVLIADLHAGATMTAADIVIF